MKKLAKVLGVTALVFLLGFGTSMAAELTLQEILNNITVGGTSSVDVQNDQVANDDYWSSTASGGSFTQIIIELAGFKDQNTFGIYDAADSNKKVQLFAGPDSAGVMPGSTSLLIIEDNGSVWVDFVDSNVDFAGNLFGFYLTNANNQTFYSDTDLNFDGADHMLTFQGNNVDVVDLPSTNPGVWTDSEFVLAWEDLPLDSLRTGADYNDFVVMIESVDPVPEPATMLLLGSGLVGLGVIGRKKRK